MKLATTHRINTGGNFAPRRAPYGYPAESSQLAKSSQLAVIPGRVGIPHVPCFSPCLRASVVKAFGLMLAAAALAMAGCAKAAKVKAKVEGTAKTVVRRATLTPDPLDLNVGIDERANKNSPVALDVVFINDKNFWKAAPPMAARDWFAQKGDLQRRYGQKKLQVRSWEWVPGQQVEPILVKVPRFLNGAMVFANYPSPGTHSAPLPLGGKFKISLQKDDFVLEKQK